MNITTRKVDNMPIEDYHSPESGFLTATAIRQGLRSMAHLRAYLDGERGEQTPAMAFGEALHMAVLEPERFANTYVPEQPDPNRRTKAYKEWAAEVESAGKKVLRIDDQIKIADMKAAILSHPVAGKLFAPAREKCVECSYLADTEGGVKLAARPDAVFTDDMLIVDLKTAQDASYNAFQRAVGTYAYHVQAALAVDLVSAAEGWKPSKAAWVWAVVEKEPPYAVKLYAADSEMIEVGRAIVHHVVKQAEKCRTSGVWPGYTNEVETMSLPGWALEI